MLFFRATLISCLALSQVGYAVSSDDELPDASATFATEARTAARQLSQRPASDGSSDEQIVPNEPTIWAPARFPLPEDAGQKDTPTLDRSSSSHEDQRKRKADNNDRYQHIDEGSQPAQKRFRADQQDYASSIGQPLDLFPNIIGRMLTTSVCCLQGNSRLTRADRELAKGTPQGIREAQKLYWAVAEDPNIRLVGYHAARIGLAYTFIKQENPDYATAWQLLTEAVDFRLLIPKPNLSPEQHYFANACLGALCQLGWKNGVKGEPDFAEARRYYTDYPARGYINDEDKRTAANNSLHMLCRENRTLPEVSVLHNARTHHAAAVPASGRPLYQEAIAEQQRRRSASSLARTHHVAAVPALGRPLYQEAIAEQQRRRSRSSLTRVLNKAAVPASGRPVNVAPLAQQQQTQQGPGLHLTFRTTPVSTNVGYQQVGFLQPQLDPTGSALLIEAANDIGNSGGLPNSHTPDQSEKVVALARSDSSSSASASGQPRSLSTEEVALVRDILDLPFLNSSSTSRPNEHTEVIIGENVSDQSAHSQQQSSSHGAEIHLLPSERKLLTQIGAALADACSTGEAISNFRTQFPLSDLSDDAILKHARRLDFISGLKVQAGLADDKLSTIDHVIQRYREICPQDNISNNDLRKLIGQIRRI